MATVYKIEIETTSAFVSYSEDKIKEIFECLIKEYKDKNTQMRFESTEVKVKIKGRNKTKRKFSYKSKNKSIKKK